MPFVIDRSRTLLGVAATAPVACVRLAFLAASLNPQSNMNALLQSTLVQTPENSKHDNAVQDFERDVWSNIPLQAIKQRLQHFADERDWNQYHTPRNLTLALVRKYIALLSIERV
jgi:hypothetical protein